MVLALGIGVNATGFTIMNAAFLRGLPFEDGRLYMLSWQTRSGDRSTLSHADLQDWRTRSRTLTRRRFDDAPHVDLDPRNLGLVMSRREAAINRSPVGSLHSALYRIYMVGAIV